MAKRKVHTNIAPCKLGTPAPLFRYHGTRRACLIGNENPGPGRYLQTCLNTECNVCQILRNSFQLGFSSPNAMFGRGIYSSTCFSMVFNITADVYAKNRHVRSEIHAMLVCAVVLGKPAEVYQADHNFDQTYGSRFDSAATIAENSSVLHPETIVYSEDAIIPMGLITYTRTGWVPR
ncbi:hypothetical protein C8A01DRAFT_17747 [Parachaetomium inaequale]|uniref:PARP catalytic domain-containing protein n=1 Tax=Parachaetomium inaequale TaxID=2588326 RepID=A0AAN6SPC7_9PEZI|nr:hypothetical protein C8A01DRAFT_17747 [Parachaetomium inaequale]